MANQGFKGHQTCKKKDQNNWWEPKHDRVPVAAWAEHRTIIKEHLHGLKMVTAAQRQHGAEHKGLKESRQTTSCTTTTVTQPAAVKNKIYQPKEMNPGHPYSSRSKGRSTSPSFSNDVYSLAKMFHFLSRCCPDFEAPKLSSECLSNNPVERPSLQSIKQCFV